MAILKDIFASIIKEIEEALKEYLKETKTAVKKRLKTLLITTIIFSVLLALIISFLGSAALFLLIGQLKYLSTFMPAWAAWDIMGLTSGVIGAFLILVLYLIIRKQLKTN